MDKRRKTSNGEARGDQLWRSVGRPAMEKRGKTSNGQSHGRPGEIGTGEELGGAQEDR
jgi:hypothetical protein